MDILDIKPVFHSIEPSQRIGYGSAIMYNQAGYTYNELGGIYGGIYGNEGSMPKGDIQNPPIQVDIRQIV